MVNQKIETFIYEDFGFPVQLIDVPLKKVFGEWILDINLNNLQIQILKLIIQQATPIQSSQLRFIRKHFEMTSSSFGEVFGVTHAAVLKWENGHLPSSAMDVCVRMYVMERLNAKNSEFGKLFHKINMSSLATAKKKRLRVEPLAISY